MKKKDTSLIIRISETDKQTLQKTAERLDIPVSQIVREAVRERISDLVKKDEQQTEPALTK